MIDKLAATVAAMVCIWAYTNDLMLTSIVAGGVTVASTINAVRGG